MLRLRSGAFALDFPIVIFVQAFGLPFRFPRAHLHAPRPRNANPTGCNVCILAGFEAGAFAVASELEEAVGSGLNPGRTALVVSNKKSPSVLPRGFLLGGKNYFFLASSFSCGSEVPEAESRPVCV